MGFGMLDCRFMGPLTLKISHSIHEIPVSRWNALHSGAFPFARHEFLSALETQGCVGLGTGWIPVYLTVWDGEELAGAAYLYEKDDSFGEFVFDWEWADAYARHRLNYYPKLVAAVPFTPANGPKFLLRPGPHSFDVGRRLAEAARDFIEERQFSGLHFLFQPAEEAAFTEELGFSIRHGFQYHWENKSYRSFDDFLNSLKRKRRQQIASERRQVEKAAVSVEILSGDDLDPDHGSLMFEFSAATFLKKNGTMPYLTEGFFREIFASMKERIVLFLARSEGRPVAAALHFRENDRLFGRYWGGFSDFKFLHFELCYYAPIQYAIEQGIRIFEAGAGGEHKIMRGFVPTLTYSAHWIRHPGFRQAIGNFIEEEKRLIGLHLERMKAHSPYKEG